MYQTPQSMGFSRQECWSGLPFPSPGDLPDPRIELTSPVSPASQADSLPTELSGKPTHWTLGQLNKDFLNQEFKDKIITVGVQK